MVQFGTSRLDAAFAALSDATRRGVLEQLGRWDASITELADRFHMTLTGMKKHVGILEQAGLVTTRKVGRVRTCALGRSRLAEETAWIEDYRRLWASRFDGLEQIVDELKQKEIPMGAERQSDPAAGKAGTTVERISELELVVTRTIDGPARLVFEAWTKPDLFQRWWAPKSFCVSLISYEADVRTGGSYRLVLGHPSSEQPMAFFGRYIEVTPPARLVWTNDEAGEGGAVTTVTFEERDGATRIVVHELYSSKAALDDAMASGSTGGWGEQFEQLDDLVGILDAKG